MWLLVYMKTSQDLWDLKGHLSQSLLIRDDFTPGTHALSGKRFSLFHCRESCWDGWVRGRDAISAKDNLTSEAVPCAEPVRQARLWLWAHSPQSSLSILALPAEPHSGASAPLVMRSSLPVSFAFAHGSGLRPRSALSDGSLEGRSCSRGALLHTLEEGYRD